MALRYTYWRHGPGRLAGMLIYGEGGCFWICSHVHHTRYSATSCARRHRMHLNRTRQTLDHGLTMRDMARILKVRVDTWR